MTFSSLTFLRARIASDTIMCLSKNDEKKSFFSPHFVHMSTKNKCYNLNLIIDMILHHIREVFDTRFAVRFDTR